MPTARGPRALVIAAPVMRRGIGSTLADAGWEVATEPGGPAVDLVICEVTTSGAGVDIPRLRAAGGGAPILVVADAVTPGLLSALVTEGASGAVDREVDEGALVQAARAVIDGRVVINAGSRVDGSAGRPPALTRRESQVLGLLAAGNTNHEVAEALVISENTVKNHIRRLYEKLQVRSRTEAVVRAARWGLVRIDAADPAPPDGHSSL